MNKANKMPVKAIIFDCFGVFYVDPFKHFIDSAQPAVRQQLRDIMLQEDLGKVNEAQVIAAYSDLTGQPKQEVAQQLYGMRLVRNEALLAFAEGLRTRFKLGLLSNLSPGAIDKYFTPAERRKYFDMVVVSSEVGLIKPQPEIYELAAERLGVAPQATLFIDDLAQNCDGARSAGMQAILYQNMEQLQKDITAIVG